MSSPRLRLVAAALVLVVALGCAAKPSPAPRSPRLSGVGRVEMTVTGFESEEGQVLIALFVNDHGWPNDEEHAFASMVLPIENLQADAAFDDVPAGPFAVSVFHDRDLDRELDTGIFGIPTEDYGFSRDARDTFGPPSFADARLDLAPDESLQITIRVE